MQFLRQDFRLCTEKKNLNNSSYTQVDTLLISAHLFPAASS